MTDKIAKTMRSFLFVPGANTKALEKARLLPADCIIFDLEDAVAPDGKDAARAAVVSAIAEGGYGARTLIIRTNAINSDWFTADIEACISAKCGGILLPKISAKTELEEVDTLVKSLGGAKSIPLWAMIETPMAIINIAQICGAAIKLPLRGIILGLNDLAKEIGARQEVNRVPFHYAMATTVNAASAYNIMAIDAVFNDIKDQNGFAQQAEQARDFGFDGKCVIHPSQIELCNQIFAPSENEIEVARAIVAAFADPINQGKAVIEVGGQMVELLHLKAAQELLRNKDLP